MQNHKGFRRFICVTVLCALLMVSMGRATRVSAVGTTAAIAGTAFILTGAVYVSYLALTNGQIDIPAVDNINDWLGGIGRKVSQFSSGRDAYQELYQGLLRDPTANVIDGVWTWTEEKLKSFVNDFSDTRINQDITSYVKTVDTDGFAANGFLYPGDYTTIPEVVWSGGRSFPFNQYQFLATGPRVSYVNYEQHYYYFVQTTLEGTWRNFKGRDGYYYAERLDNGVWTRPVVYYAYGYNTNSSYYPYLNVYGNAQGYVTAANPSGYFIQGVSRPYFPDLAIFDEALDDYLPLEVPNTEVDVRTPQWLDPDNDNRPIIPWVPIPNLPDIPNPPSFTNPPSWGFPLQDLLDLLESLAEGLLKIDAIARLINEFAGQHGDNYYLEFNDGDTNYYTYYQPTVFDNDTEYVTYNIDISGQEEVIPVDLNTISLYTQNEYLDAVKQSARNFGNAIGEYVAFWHNTDYTLTYTILGGFVLILIGAFIGKWGHS